MRHRLAPITLAVEGGLDEVILTKLVRKLGGEVGHVYGHKGKPYLLEKLRGFNNAARFAPWVVLLDLNGDADCAPTFSRVTLAAPASGMRLRVAVRAVEAWLMADRENFAGFLGVSIRDVPSNPEGEANPKARLLDLARTSRRSGLKSQLLPTRGSTAKVGPLYNARLAEYAGSNRGGWRPMVAARSSESLRRCISAIESLLRWSPETTV
jgi:hypothetical protein